MKSMTAMILVAVSPFIFGIVKATYEEIKMFTAEVESWKNR